MKKRVLFFVFFLYVSLGAQSISDQIESAHQLYKQKDFSGALAKYQAVPNKGWAAWYNIGNCYYNLQDYEHAVTCWQRALQQVPLAEQQRILHNIAQAQKKVGSSSTALETQTDHFTHALVEATPLIAVQLIFIMILFLFFFIIKKYNNSRKYKTLVILFLFFNVVMAIIVIWKYQIMQQRKGIIMKPNVRLYAGPDTQFHPLANVDHMKIVVINKRHNNWCKISCNGKAGWVPSDTVAEL